MLWWRDDDAADAGPALDRLLQVCHKTAAPLALAVVPALVAVADRAIQIHWSGTQQVLRQVDMPQLTELAKLVTTVVKPVRHPPRRPHSPSGASDRWPSAP